MDSEAGGEGAYSKFDWYALRENYCGAVAQSGGLPIPLPHEPELAQHYLDLIDGLLITGGAFDEACCLANGCCVNLVVRCRRPLWNKHAQC